MSAAFFCHLAMQMYITLTHVYTWTSMCAQPKQTRLELYRELDMEAILTVAQLLSGIHQLLTDPRGSLFLYVIL